MNKAPKFEFIPDKEKHTLTMRREFRAGRDLVWDCHTRSELLEQWFAPQPLVAKTKTMDFRAGGYWLYAMVEPGGKEHWGRMNYNRINPKESYSGRDGFCNEKGELNTDLPQANWDVTFIDQGQNTLVQSILTFGSLADLEAIVKMGMEEGMTTTLERLDELLVTLAKKTNPTGKALISIQAHISKGAAQVWDYYTDPKHIIHWNFASDDWKCPSASNDMRVGGKYAARMEAKDGSFGFDFEAVYRAITDKKAFTYVLEDGRVIDVQFRDKGASTEIKVDFEAESQNPLDMQKAGWQAILDNFKKYAESR